MTTMGLQYLNLQETQRANLEKERQGRDTITETARHNVANEEVALGNLEVSRGTLDESVRSNKAREYETNRSNVAKEFEMHRSNVARENETHRSNVVDEHERNRSNVARETETHRSNVVNETEQNRANTTKEAENNRANTLKYMNDYMSQSYAYETGVKDKNNLHDWQQIIGTGLETLSSVPFGVGSMKLGPR